MRSATLVTVLTRLTTAMAVAAPVVVFGFLYVLQVQPERTAAEDVRHQLAVARDELNRRRSLLRSKALDKEPEVEGDRAGDLAEAVTALLNSPAVGGASNVSIDSGSTVTVTFDARYEQIGRFFWHLRVLTTAFDLHSVDLTPLTVPAGGLTRARVSLVALHRPETVGTNQPPLTDIVDVDTPPIWARDPFASPPRPDASRAAGVVAQPDPVVSGILYSSGRRVALIDGRLVGPGDRVGGGVVLSIEANAVVITEPGGRERRVEIARPAVRLANR